MTLEEQCAIIAREQRAQLAAPARAVVNSESAFVRSRIGQAGYPELAREYWSWSCRGGRGRYTEEVIELEARMRAIDQGCTMPAWGTYGT
jgi:hypothetical protein